MTQAGFPAAGGESRPLPGLSFFNVFHSVNELTNDMGKLKLDTENKVMERKRRWIP